jgi:hypothetical protein
LKSDLTADEKEVAADVASSAVAAGGIVILDWTSIDELEARRERRFSVWVKGGLSIC